MKVGVFSIANFIWGTVTCGTVFCVWKIAVSIISHIFCSLFVICFPTLYCHNIHGNINLLGFRLRHSDSACILNVCVKSNTLLHIFDPSSQVIPCPVVKGIICPPPICTKLFYCISYRFTIFYQKFLNPEFLNPKRPGMCLA